MFNPQYTLTNRILALLTAITEAKAVIERARLLPQHELRLRRQALIRMTHASTSIEGNLLNLHQVEAIARHKKIDAPARDVYEVENYLKALTYIGTIVEKRRPITERVILAIHRLVTDKTLPPAQSGHYRTDPVYVVRRRLGMPDETIYTAPEAHRVPLLMRDVIAWMRESERNEVHPVIAAGIVHAEIAAIHPFADGNGRTARALATLLLYHRGYDFRRLFALEDYYNRARQDYYAAIHLGPTYNERTNDLTPWLEYFTEGFKQEVSAVLTKVASLAFVASDRIESQIYLDKAQLTLIDFLEKVGIMTVRDVMQVLECPKRTAQLALQRLKEAHIIVQRGKGPASSYVLVERKGRHARHS